MNTITKIHKIAKDCGLVLKPKNYPNVGQCWLIYTLGTGAMINGIFPGDPIPRRLQAFRSVVAATLSPDDWATLPPQLANELK